MFFYNKKHVFYDEKRLVFYAVTTLDMAPARCRKMSGMQFVHPITKVFMNSLRSM